MAYTQQRPYRKKVIDKRVKPSYNNSLNTKGARMYAIEAINTMPTCANYCDEAVAEFEAGLGDGIDKYTGKFYVEVVEGLGHTDSDDIGGLIVYLRGSVPVAVYDYENFCGWIL